MKRFFTLAALFISMMSFAAAPSKAGRIIINNDDNNIIQVRINGRSYNVNQQALVLSNLNGGRHQLEIFRTERKPYNWGKSKTVLIYSSAVYVDPSFIVDVNINRMGRVSIGKSIIVKNGNDRYVNDNRYGNDTRYDNNNRYNNDNRNGHDDRYTDNRNDAGYPGRNDVKNGNVKPGKSFENNDKGSRPDKSRF